MKGYKEKRELGQERTRDWRERNTKKEGNGREEGGREGRKETKLTGRKERREGRKK